MSFKWSTSENGFYQRKELRFKTLSNVKIEECIQINDKIGPLTEVLSNSRMNGKIICCA